MGVLNAFTYTTLVERRTKRKQNLPVYSMAILFSTSISMIPILSHFNQPHNIPTVYHWVKYKWIATSIFIISGWIFWPNGGLYWNWAIFTGCCCCYFCSVLFCVLPNPLFGCVNVLPFDIKAGCVNVAITRLVSEWKICAVFNFHFVSSLFSSSALSLFICCNWAFHLDSRFIAHFHKTKHIRSKYKLYSKAKHEEKKT